MRPQMLALFAAVLSVAVSLPGAADAAQGCPRANGAPATVTVNVMDGGLSYNFTRSSAEIAALGAQGGMHAHGHNVAVRGLTTTAFRSGFSVSVSYQQSRGGGVCVRPVALRADLGYDPTTIYVQRDYPDGSCQRTVVLDHEHGHVRINREVFAQHLPYMRAALEQAANDAAYPVWAQDIESGTAIVTAAINASLRAQSLAFQNRRDQMHAVLDSPESYRATQNACPRW